MSTFMTCGNDGTVKVWSVDLDSHALSCVKTIEAYGHFIYTMAVIDESEQTWAVGGEDGGVRVFRDSQVRREARLVGSLKILV